MTSLNLSSKEIIGCWRLISYVLHSTSGNAIPIWGKNADGIIIYLDNGYMSVQVSDRDRPKFEANDFLCGETTEIKRAFEGYTTYFGTYEYDAMKGVVLHHVSQSLYPNWSGITHTRYVSFEENKLLIKTPPLLVDKNECILELSWTRI